MIRHDDDMRVSFDTAIRWNSHVWDNWGRLFSRYREALCGQLAPRCPTCGGEVQPDLACACFEPIAGE